MCDAASVDDLAAPIRPDAETIIETPNLWVWRVRRPSAGCVVTFGNHVDRPALQRPGFGEAFLAAIGVDAVHVNSRGNDWFQYPEMPAVLAAIRTATAGSGRLVTYGSSMGGFAAVRFAGTLGAVAAVALSPQHSIDPRQVPFEERWQAEARRIRFLPEFGDPGPPRVYVFHDSVGPDAEHARLLAERYRVTPIAIPHGGHPVATYLMEVGLLGGIIPDVLADRFDAAALGRAARARRRQSGQYLSTLAMRQPPTRPRWKLNLAGMAVQASPRSSHLASRLGGLLYRAGVMGEAEAMHRRALALDPGSPILLFRLSLFLRRLGRIGEALELAAQAAEADPGSVGLRRHLVRLRRQNRRGNPLGQVLRWQDAALHRLTLLAWRRGWPALGRIEQP